MPRARIPNASFIASAEFPILPFLAPRVFAESPITRRNDQHYAKRRGSQKEKEKVVKDGAGPKTSCALPRHRCLRIAAGLLSNTSTRWRFLNSTGASSPMALRYADISTFARQQIRDYRAVAASRNRVAPRTNETPERSVQVDAARQTPGRNRRAPLLAARREQAMALERERLANLISHKPGHNVVSLLEDGQYRSLRRRITNLQRWDVTQLDFGQKRGGSLKHSNMIRAFAALDRSLYSCVRQHTRRILIRHDPRCVRWSTTLFRDAAKHELHQTWKNWMQLNVGTRRSAYQRLLIYLLDRKPGRAMQFIHVLANDPLLRDTKTEAIADALGHLSKLHAKGSYAANGGWSLDKRAVKRSFVPGFIHIFRKALAGRRDVCSQDLLFNIVHLADTKDLRKVFDCLVENRAFLGFDTLLHYANAFAQAGEFQSALRCLDELKAMSKSTGWEAVSDRERLRWTCALILRKSIANGQDYHETPGIVAAIVRLGIKMDILMYNVVMHNAMEAGDYATAFKVYNALNENGLKADKHTYSILLHGCASQSNPAMFSQFALHCVNVAQEIHDPWLATEYLYYLYVRLQNDPDKAQTLALLQQAYRRFFLARPIELLGNRLQRVPNSDTDNQSLSTNTAKFAPPSVALYIMLQAQIQLALMVSSQQVLNIYQRFKLLVQQNVDPAVTRLAKRPNIWNAFLLAFCKKQQFASASQLIKDMTDHTPQPNIYSWNIFMQAFFKTGQVQAAERVFEILRNRGVDPDQFTYGVMLRGYAKAQHVEHIGHIMQHVGTEEEMNPDLLRSLARVVNRNKLMVTLEKSHIHKKVKAEENARHEAEEERKRWELPQLNLDEREASESILKTFPPNEEVVEGYNGLQFQSDSEAEHDSMGPPSTQQLEPSVKQPRPPTPRNMPPHQETPQDSFDPEIQYRKLQEQLGVLAPSSKSADEERRVPAQPFSPFGAGLSFKSMLPRDDTMPETSEELAKLGIRKIYHELKNKPGEG